jgi:5-formyltetrahydrofolate cyclo-ligase
MAVPPPAPDPAAATLAGKAAMRADLRRARRAFNESLSPEERATALAAIARQLAPMIARGGPIAGYVAHRDEVDILPVLHAAVRQGHVAALPYVSGIGNAMRFTGWHPDAALAAGFAGILQPDGAGDEIVPAIVLTPLVGFDRAGRRLGQGGGFYDRWFAAHPAAMRIGIAWSVQEVPGVAADAWDMPLHAIVTEKEWIAP